MDRLHKLHNEFPSLITVKRFIKCKATEQPSNSIEYSSIIQIVTKSVGPEELIKII